MTAPDSGDRRPWDRALVVFVGRADLWWLRLLKPGFRHCFVVLGSPGGWIALDPRSNVTEVSVLPVDCSCDLAAWYRGQGHAVAEARPPRTTPPAGPLAALHLRRGGQARPRGPGGICSYSVAAL